MFSKLMNEKAAQRVSSWAGYPADVHADILADVRGQKLRSGPRKSLENKHFSADIHDSKARTSMTPGAFEQTLVRKSSGCMFIPYNFARNSNWSVLEALKHGFVFAASLRLFLIVKKEHLRAAAVCEGPFIRENSIGHI